MESCNPSIFATEALRSDAETPSTIFVPQDLTIDLQVPLHNVAALIFAHMPPAQVIQVMDETPGFNWPEPEAQEALDQILSYCDRFHLSPKYAKALLKAIQVDVEKSNAATIEDCMMERILEAYCAPVTNEEEGDEAYFSYVVPSSALTTAAAPAPATDTEPAVPLNFVPLRVMRAHNQVGLRVWEAGLFLAELCLAVPPALFHEKTVLELGAGIGLTGIIVARGLGVEHAPKKMILSDWAEVVLENIKHNVAINFCEDARVENESTPSVDVVQVDWRAMTTTADVAQTVGSTPADITLIADCTYSEDIIPPLLKTIALVIKHWEEKVESKSNDMNTAAAANKQQETLPDVDDMTYDCAPNDDSNLLQRIASRQGHIAILACTQRSDETFEFLQIALKEMNLSCRNLTTWAHTTCKVSNPLLPIANRERIHLYCIHK
jgi:predicted nicotinamide N-methyase